MMLSSTNRKAKQALDSKSKAHTRKRKRVSAAKKYTAFGENKTLQEFALEYNIRVGTIKHRIRARWDIEDAISTPVRAMNKKEYTYKGETLGVREWARRLGMKTHTMELRYDSGWSAEKAIETPVRGSR